MDLTIMRVRLCLGAVVAAVLLTLGVGVPSAWATDHDTTTTTVEPTTTTVAPTTSLFPPWTAEDERSHAVNMETAGALVVFLLAALTVMRFRS